MSALLPWLLGIFVVSFIVQIFLLWRALWKNYRYLRTKYPVSIWKLPSRNLHLLNEEDRKLTRKLYIRYILTIVFGLIGIIAFSALVQVYE